MINSKRTTQTSPWVIVQALQMHEESCGQAFRGKITEMQSSLHVPQELGCASCLGAARSKYEEGIEPTFDL